MRNIIIINADDFGLSHIVNSAISHCFKQGIISSTTVMMNMPCAKEAVQTARDNGFTDSIGLHFNIMEGKPMTKEILDCPRICADGENFTYKRNSIFLWSKKEIQAIKVEFRAQLSALLSLGISPSHIDSHLHTHTELPIMLAILPVIKENNIKSVRISRNLGVRGGNYYISFSLTVCLMVLFLRLRSCWLN